MTPETCKACGGFSGGTCRVCNGTGFAPSRPRQDFGLTEDLKPGVDEIWIADHREVTKTLAPVFVGPQTACIEVGRLADMTAHIADAMAEERRKRGGVRSGDDIGEMISKVQEHAPMLLAQYEKMMTRIAAVGEKMRRQARRKRDDEDDF